MEWELLSDFINHSVRLYPFVTLCKFLFLCRTFTDRVNALYVFSFFFLKKKVNASERGFFLMRLIGTKKCQKRYLGSENKCIS
jgi:hypothetical protein